MPHYLVERTLCAPAHAVTAADRIDADRSDEVIRVHAQEGVTWIHSFITADRRRSYCIVDSPSPEAIRVAAQTSVLPVDRITEVSVFEPSSL